MSATDPSEAFGSEISLSASAALPPSGRRSLLRGVAGRLRATTAGAAGGRRRRRSPSRSRSSAPSPIGTSSPAASRRSRKCRSAPASAASSPVSSSRTATWCMPATCSMSSTPARSRRWPSRPTASSPMRAPRPSWPSASSIVALTLVQTSAVSEQVVDQRRQALQAAHAAEMQAEGALKAAQLNIEFTHVMAPITGRVSRHLVSVGNLVQGSDNGTSTLLDHHRLARSDLHLFRRGRGDLPAETTSSGSRASGRARATRRTRCR